ncbi:21545_t:CDS:2, partial [Gigaspora rosea]
MPFLKALAAKLTRVLFPQLCGPINKIIGVYYLKDEYGDINDLKSFVKIKGELDDLKGLNDLELTVPISPNEINLANDTRMKRSLSLANT